MAVKLGINGFGRIARCVLRILTQRDDFEVVAINVRNMDVGQYRALFKYDSAYGPFEGTVEATDDALVVNGKEVKFTGHGSLDDLNWSCLLYTSPSPRDLSTSRMPSSA